MHLFLHDSSRKGTLYSTPLYSSCLSYLRTGPTWATWSSGQSICKDSRSAVKQSGIMMLESRKRTIDCSWVGKEGGRLWGGGFGEARRACLLPTEGRSAGSSTFASIFCAPSSRSSCLSSQSSFWFILWWSSSLCVCMLTRSFWRYSQVF